MRLITTLCFVFSISALSYPTDWKVGDDFDPTNPPVDLWSYIAEYPNYYVSYPFKGGVINAYITGADGVRLYSDHCMLRTGERLAHWHVEKDFGDPGMPSVATANQDWYQYFQNPLYNENEITRNTLIQIDDATTQFDCGSYVFRTLFPEGEYNYIIEVENLEKFLSIEAYEVDLSKERLKPYDFVYYWVVGHFAMITEIDTNTGLPAKYRFKYNDSPVYECDADPNHPYYSPGGSETNYKIYRRKPACWLYSRQCHGDADGLKEGNWTNGFYYVGDDDLAILNEAYNIKEPPYGPGLTEDQMCADFDHQLEGNPLVGYRRVHNSDLNILLAYWQIKESPNGEGVPADCLD